MKRPARHEPGPQNLVPLDSLRPEIAELICADHPQIRAQGRVPAGLVRDYRERHIATLLRDDLGQLSTLDAEVARAIASGDRISALPEDEADPRRSFGDKAADAIAAFGGSWTFILLFGLFLAIWMAVSRLMGQNSFDPFPFILLNLILSTLAAIQAPVIMMSQNRQEEKDRMRARNDYQVNLKAELEIRLLHERMEWLIARTARDVRKAEASLDPGPPD